MAEVKLKFKTLGFNDLKDKVRVSFHRIYFFLSDKDEIKKIADFRLEENSIIFRDISEKKANAKFNILLDKDFNNLKNSINNRKTVYIHKNSGIPLIGVNYFGIIDRGTNCIEVKPVTGCNLDCIYCSINEGKDFEKVDFLIEEEYLFEELKKVIEFKECDGIEIHIASQGETLLYPELTSFISDISRIRKVKNISIDTNGILLSKQKVDELTNAGLTRVNLSINALDPDLAKKIAGASYSPERIKEIAEYIPKRCDLIIAPVLLKGINEDEIEKIIEFALEIGAGKNCPPVGVQNFLIYKVGKKPVKQLDWEDFYSFLRPLEKKFDIPLIFTQGGMNIRKCNALPKPFKKGDIIEAEIICPGRLKNEKLAVSKNRLISIRNCYKDGTVRIKLLRSKHNIFVGKVL